MFITAGDIIIYVTVFFGVFTSLFFLITLLENEHKLRPRRRVKYEKVCIIIPCYNEEETVAKTIESLLDLDYPRGKLEIMVIDDGSRDDTYRIAKRYEKRGVKVFRKPNGGKYTALNYGIQRTDAVYVGALDADSFVDRRALKRMIPYFANPKVMAVTPCMKVHEPKHWLQKVQWTEYTMGIFLRKVFSFLGSITVTPGPFSIYRREFFLKHGLYRHAHNTEDQEVALRIQSLDYEIENAHDAYVYTVSPDRLKTLWNQRIRWYYGFIRNSEDYKQLFSWRHGVLGILVLPASIISVLLVIAGVLYTIFQFISQSIDKLTYLRATGYDLFQWRWTFDAFFVNLNSAAILGIIAFILGIIVIMVAKSMAREDKSMIKPYLWFIATYWILYAAWWLGAIQKRIFGKNVGWKHKSEA
jgi:cellulose synthase/poly-beta-1,6-N-acetylglucosamine synthase-like glycosyltransferase